MEDIKKMDTQKLKLFKFIIEDRKFIGWPVSIESQKDYDETVKELQRRSE